MAEAYLPKGGQKESAGGEEEGAVPSASDKTRRGRSSLAVPAQLMGVISTAVIVPHLATTLGTSIQRHLLARSSVERTPKAGGEHYLCGERVPAVTGYL